MKALTLLVAAAALLTLACSDDDDADGAGDQAAVCRGVEQTRASLNDILENVVPLNEAGIRDALQSTRADIDTISVSVEEAQGGGSPESVEQWRRTFRPSSALWLHPSSQRPT